MWFFFFLLFHFVFFLLFFTDVCSCSCLSWVSDIQLGLYHKKKTQTHQFILWAQKKEEKKEKSWKIIEPLQFENTSEQQTRNIFAVGTSVTWHIFLPSVFFFLEMEGWCLEYQNILIFSICTLWINHWVGWQTLGEMWDSHVSFFLFSTLNLITPPNQDYLSSRIANSTCWNSGRHPLFFFILHLQLSTCALLNITQPDSTFWGLTYQSGKLQRTCEIGTTEPF